MSEGSERAAPAAAWPEAPARGAGRSTAGHLLRIVLTLVVCALAWAWLARHADLRALAGQAGRIPAWTWGLAAAGLLGGHAMRALRLQREWRHVAPVRWWTCLRIVLAHNALVLMLPLRSGEAGYLWQVRRQWGVGWGVAGLGLLRWRLQDAAILLLLAAALLLPVSAPWRVGGTLLAAGLLHVVLTPLWAWLQRRSGAEGLPAGRGLWSGVPTSAANWLLKVLANGLLLAAFAGLPLATAWRAALGGELAGVQPLQPPAGLGVYEAGIWFAAGLPATEAPRVVAAALAVHAFSLALALGAAALAQLVLPPSAAREESPS